MAETRSGRLDRATGAVVPPEPKTMADVRREIGEIRQRISTSVRMAERRASAVVGVEDFDQLPTGWRGLALVAGSMFSRIRGYGPAGPHLLAIGGLMITLLIGAIWRSRRRG